MSDEIYLLDMLIAATKSLRFVDNLDFSEFNHSDIHQSAVVKQLEVIGEAENRVSESFRNAHSDIPWRQIIGMRHRLIHDYKRIDLSTIWETVQSDLATLIGQLQPLIPKDEGE